MVDIFNKNSFIIVLLIVFIILMIYIKFIHNNPKKNTELIITKDSKKKYTRPKIINFNTSWCGYSQQFQPIWNSFTDAMNEKT